MKTAVITGASSGIGKLTALRLAQNGFDVVLAARRESLLNDVARECREYGVQAFAVKADVANPDDIQGIAQSALDHFGKIDIWINNAGVIMYGRFLDVSPEEFRQTIETNLFGVTYGSRSALAQFKKQGYGTLINIASGYGAVPAPYASPYITSKFAVRGLSASLHEELVADGIDNIHVCTVLPTTIDTPVYASSGNKMEHKVRALPPVYPPEKVVDTIVDLIDNPKVEAATSNIMRLPIVLYALSPDLFTRIFAKYVRKFGFDKKRPSAYSAGNLFTPSTNSGVRGGWQTEEQRFKRKILPIAILGFAVYLMNSKRKKAS